MLYRDLENLKKSSFLMLQNEGRYQIPCIKGQIQCNCMQWIGFNYAKACKDTQNTGVHFFVDDYQFERIWTRPAIYAQMLSRYSWVLSPDYSMFTNMPLAMQLWKHYQKQWFGAFCESEGIKVIPTLCWSDDRSFEFCFDGIPKESVVAVSSVGCMNDMQATEKFISGFNKAIDVLEPTQVMLWGAKPEGLRECNLTLFDHLEFKFIVK